MRVSYFTDSATMKKVAAVSQALKTDKERRDYIASFVADYAFQNGLEITSLDVGIKELQREGANLEFVSLTYADAHMHMVGLQVKYARQVLGWTQKKMSLFFGWSTERQLSDIENGKKEATRQTKLAIEAALRRLNLWDEFNSRCQWL